MSPSPENSRLSTMRFMEVRGGNRAVDEAFQTPGFDVWVFSLPFGNCVSGGDLQYVAVSEDGAVTRVVVADVSGHGGEVADVSESLRSLMRKTINTRAQACLLGGLNRQFGLSAQTPRFATAVVATYLATDRSLTVCNAGHPRPLWYQAGPRAWGLLDHESAGGGNLPFGLQEKSPSSQFTVGLGLGDVLLFYTDALTEATTPDGFVLGEEGLLTIARTLDLSSPHQIAPALIDAVGRHRSGRPPEDDMTLVTLLHNGCASV